MTNSGDRSNRSVSIGGDATGNIVQSGDNNVAKLGLTQTTLPPPESVDIKAELAALRDLVRELKSEDEKKIGRAIEDAQDEAAKLEPNRDEIGIALERALATAQKAENYVKMVDRLKGHVTKVVSWLGDHWHNLLSLVGLTL